MNEHLQTLLQTAAVVILFLWIKHLSVMVNRLHVHTHGGVDEDGDTIDGLISDVDKVVDESHGSVSKIETLERRALKMNIEKMDASTNTETNFNDKVEQANLNTGGGTMDTGNKS